MSIQYKTFREVTIMCPMKDKQKIDEIFDFLFRNNYRILRSGPELKDHRATNKFKIIAQKKIK